MQGSDAPRTTDDIVTRLMDDRFMSPPYGLLHEAANEIERLRNLASREAIVLSEVQQVFLARLRAAGWMIVQPGCVGMPRDRKEAAAMNLLSEQYLRDHPHA